MRPEFNSFEGKEAKILLRVLTTAECVELKPFFEGMYFKDRPLGGDMGVGV